MNNLNNLIEFIDDVNNVGRRRPQQYIDQTNNRKVRKPKNINYQYHKRFD